VNKKLLVVSIAIEVISLAALFFLLRQPGLPEAASVILVFCLPITFGLHVFEEFVFPGGGADWFRRDRPQFTQAMTDSYFFNVNAIPLVLSLLVTLGTFNFTGGFSFFGIRAWLAFLCFQAIHVGFSHLRGAIKARRYSPGMATGIALYLPLTIMAFVTLLRSGILDPVLAIVCIGLGYLILVFLDRLKMARQSAAAQ